MAGGPRKGNWEASPSHVTAGFLKRGQKPSSDSQASINFHRREGRAWFICPPRHVKGKLEKGRRSSVVWERAHLWEAQTENEKTSWVNEWMD